jgi:hypothetical protein
MIFLALSKLLKKHTRRNVVFVDEYVRKIHILHSSLALKWREKQKQPFVFIYFSTKVFKDQTSEKNKI